METAISMARDLRPAVAGWQGFLRETSTPDTTFGKACESHLAELKRRRSRSLADQESVIRRHVDPALAELPCGEIRPAHLEAWIEWQTSQGYAPKTVRKHLSIVSSVLESAMLSGAIESNPARQVAKSKLPPRRPRDPDRAANEVLEPEQVARLIWDPRIPELRRWAWTVLLFSGARLGEFAALEWRDVIRREPLWELKIERQWARKAGELRTPKTDRPRRVPVHPVLSRAIAEMRLWRQRRGLSAEGKELLCPSIRGRYLRRWSDRTLLTAWRRDLETLGIPQPSAGPHRLHAARHTFVSLLLRQGVSELVIARMTHPGRSTGPGSSILVYAHEDWPSLCQAVLRYPLDENQRESYARQLSMRI